MIGEAVAPLPAQAALSAHTSGHSNLSRVGVLGAGTMGSRIAAHIANAGVPVVLLDLARLDGPRNGTAAAAVEGLKRAKPAAFYEDRGASLITTGNFDDDLKRLADCDWIIEAVAEDLAIKRSLLSRVDSVRRPDSIVTTNTSGLPVAQIAEGMPESFRRRWFGTHFFNPPRYMRLLEIVPTPEADPAAVAAIEQFADKRLGKVIVGARDTPNFIANRIGTFAMINTIRIMQAMDLTFEQVDLLTGSVLGWPKTGTFRLADMVGIDVLGHVAANFQARVKDERSDVVPPEFVHEMLKRKWFGDKTSQGFYKKINDGSGNQQRLTLDWKTLEYRSAQKASFPALDIAKNIEALPLRVKALLEGNPKNDTAAAFYWQVLPDLWNYAAHRIPESAESITAIDAAMKAGFNWEMGPFELWDAAGVPETVNRMRAAGVPVAPSVDALLGSGATTWYRDDPHSPSGRRYFDIRGSEFLPVDSPEGVTSVEVLKKAGGLVQSNAGASLVDLGDGVACIEFHSKMNAIGGDIVYLIQQALKPGSEAVSKFDAFVISGDAQHFSVGANLMQLLLSIHDEDWDEIELMIRAFQDMTQSIKYCPRPVVAAPFGMCLGGGAEICLHSRACQPHAELYMGLVEAGVGLVPGGGGCKEMMLRAVEGRRVESAELMESLRRCLETIAMAKTSTSAAEARQFGLLAPGDHVTMNRGRLLLDAKAKARAIADAGYTPPTARADVPAPGENIYASLKMGLHMLREGEFISDHDLKVARWIARIICGGEVTPGTLVTEQYLLDLEREAFLSLCGERKTQERIAHTLKTGKPLRN
jgi:3-hydroxyacyl-CoA dehydrogenase